VSIGAGNARLGQAELVAFCLAFDQRLILVDDTFPGPIQVGKQNISQLDGEGFGDDLATGQVSDLLELTLASLLLIPVGSISAFADCLLYVPRTDRSSAWLGGNT
jgi:hypothetical protein